VDQSESFKISLFFVATCSITDCLKEHNLLYRTGTSLGSGSFGEVFVVEHKVDGGKYAVKKLEETSEDKAEIEVEEAKLMCHLLHRNVCRYYNAWQVSGRVHIRMELCDTDLATWLKRRNSLLFNKGDESEPYDKILRDGWVHGDWKAQHSCVHATSSNQQVWFRGIKAPGTNEFLKGLLKGVQYLHTSLPRPIAHQDLHCKNVLLKFNGGHAAVTAKICDFGLASRKTGNARTNAAGDGDFRQDLENVGKIMVRMYYPLYGNGIDELLSKLQKSSQNHQKQLNSDFHTLWPDQASWIRRLLSGEQKPTAAEMLDEGMRSESQSFRSEKYRKGLKDGARATIVDSPGI